MLKVSLVGLICLIAVFLSNQVSRAECEYPSGPLSQQERRLFEQLVFTPDTRRVFLADPGNVIFQVLGDSRPGSTVNLLQPDIFKLIAEWTTKCQVKFLLGGGETSEKDSPLLIYRTRTYGAVKVEVERKIETFVAEQTPDEVVRWESPSSASVGCLHIKLIKNNRPIRQISVIEFKSGIHRYFDRSDIPSIICLEASYFFFVGVENFGNAPPDEILNFEPRRVMDRDAFLPNSRLWRRALQQLYAGKIVSGDTREEVLRRIH